MAKKTNSVEQQVFLSVPSVRELEGTVVAILDHGVQFRYRKSGGSNMITEYFPFNEKFYTLIGDEGKEGTLYLAGHHTIYGAKKRETNKATGLSSRAPGFLGGTGVDGEDKKFSFIVNANLAEFRAEEASENAGSSGRGRKKSEKTEKPAKAEKTKAVKEDKKVKKEKKPSKKDDSDDWDD